jgi:hypothetical protein
VTTQWWLGFLTGGGVAGLALDARNWLARRRDDRRAADGDD